MAINKAINANSFNFQGSAFYKYAMRTGSLDRDNARQNSYASGLYDSEDNAMSSWSTHSTGLMVNTTGTVIFRNTLNGGSLSDVLIANRGSNNLVVGFNSESPNASSGFILSSGESMQRQGLITDIWAITSSGATIIAAQGLFNYNKNISL